MKKVNGNWDIINKNGHSKFHTGKPGNFNSLRELPNLNYIMTLLPWKWLKSAKKNCYGY